jgi:hypothetical protein
MYLTYRHWAIIMGKATIREEFRQYVAKTFTSKPIALTSLLKPELLTLSGARPKSPADFERAYLELRGVDTVGASYVGRIFFNNPKADENTAPTAENGFAGTFSVFGHGGCGGDPGHCEATPGVRAFDKRPQNTAKDSIIQQITDALKNAIQGGKELTFTIVPVKVTGPESVNHADPLKFKDFEISLRYKTPEGKTVKHQLLTPQPAVNIR